MRLTPIIIFAAMASLLLATGCRTDHTHQTQVIQSQTTTATTPKPRIRVVSIPAQQLTPTSRSGDQSTPVYSSNIIAVYVDTNGVAEATNEATDRVRFGSPRSSEQMPEERPQPGPSAQP